MTFGDMSQIIFKKKLEIKCLGINLTKQVKDLYSENCKTLMKEIEHDTKKYKDTSSVFYNFQSIGLLPAWLSLFPGILFIASF